jgi:hypothetical protein
VILLTLLLLCTMTLCLASVFAGNRVYAWLHHHVHSWLFCEATAMVARICGWVLAAAIAVVRIDPIRALRHD